MPNRPDVLWIDGAGGWAIATADEITIGRRADIPIVARLASVTATLRRSGDDWMWRRGDEETWITDSDVQCKLGDVTVSVQRPSPLSPTRRLTVARPHRLAGGVDGIILASKMISIGPARDAAIRARHLTHVFPLLRNGHTMTIKHGEVNCEVRHGESFATGELVGMLRPWDV